MMPTQSLNYKIITNDHRLMEIPNAQMERSYERHSDKFGNLLEASAQVMIEFEPADEHTTEFINTFMIVHGLGGRPTTKQKIARCLSDFFSAKSAATNNLIFWPMGNDHFVGAAYSRDIAARVRDKLLEIKLIKVAQKSSKRDRLATIYELCFPERTRPWRLKFKQHGIFPTVEVRSPKVRRGAKITGGKRMSRRAFSEQMKLEEVKLKKIVSVMTRFPLSCIDGRQFHSCTRTFNNASMRSGGRIYGKWQNYKEEDRLKMKIGGVPVCEIDLKASYLSICNGLYGGGRQLPSDPYQIIGFVNNSHNNEQRSTMRKLAKLLVSAFLSNDHKTTQFPKGERKKIGDKYHTISVREKYGIPKRAKASDYFNEITKAFPFLLKVELDVHQIMFLESEAVIGAMLELAALDVPTFPVHDCLMCRHTDEVLVVTKLQESLLRHFKVVPALEVSKENAEPKVIVYNDEKVYNHISSGVALSRVLDLDDFDVFEDFD